MPFFNSTLEKCQIKQVLGHNFPNTRNREKIGPVLPFQHFSPKIKTLKDLGSTTRTNDFFVKKQWF